MLAIYVKKIFEGNSRHSSVLVQDVAGRLKVKFVSKYLSV